MSVYTTGEGEEEKEKASKLFKLRERKKKKHVEGNGVIPQGGMSLKSPTLLCHKASDSSTQLSNEQRQ